MSMAAPASGAESALSFPMDCHYLYGLQKSDTWCLLISIKIWRHLTCTLSPLLPIDFPEFLIDYTLGPGFRRTNHKSVTVYLWPQCRQSAEQTFSVSTSPFYLSSLMASIWSQLLAAHPVLYFFSEPGAEIWVSDILLHFSGSCISHHLPLRPYLTNPIFFLPDSLQICRDSYMQWV